MKRTENNTNNNKANNESFEGPDYLDEQETLMTLAVQGLKPKIYPNKKE